MISIVTSLYKSDIYLGKFSKKLREFARGLNEKNQPFEIIAIANDLTERERQFEKEFKGEKWFSFYSIDREPLYATWNRGVGLAKGDVVGFWNVDDIRYQEAVVEARGLFEQGAEMVFFPFKINRYLKILGKYIWVHTENVNSRILEYNEKTRKEFQRSMICGPFFMFTKSLYKRVGPFDEQFKIAGDFDWCVRAAIWSGKLVKAKSLGGEFRIDGKGLSTGGNSALEVEDNIIYKRFGAMDKIKPADDSLASHYRPELIKYQGSFIPLNLP